jgi:GGDEF domain-containing protein
MPILDASGNVITDFEDSGTLPEVSGVSRAPASRTSGISRYDAVIAHAAESFGLDQDLLRRQLRQESGGKIDAVSKKGARGLMQVMPDTRQEIFQETGIDPYRSPEESILGGAYYLRKMTDKFGGNMALGLAAYNTGEGNVRKYGGIPPFQETQDYVRAILGGARPQPRRRSGFEGGDIVDHLPSGFTLGRPEESAPVQDPEPAFEAPLSAFGAAKRGLAHGVLGLAQSIGSGAQYLGNRFGSDTLSGLGSGAAEYWGDIAKNYEAPEDLQGSVVDQPGLLATPSWWAYQLADTLPSFAASIIPGAGAYKAINVGGKALQLTPKVIERLATIGASVTGGAIGGSLEGTQTYQEVLKRGGSEEEAARAAELMTLASAGLNAVSIGKILGGGSQSALKRFGAGFLTEGTTELAEEPAEGAILGRTSVARPEDNPLQRTIQGLGVFPVAGLMGGAGAAMNRPSRIDLLADQQKEQTGQTSDLQTRLPDTDPHHVSFESTQPFGNVGDKVDLDGNGQPYEIVSSRVSNGPNGQIVRTVFRRPNSDDLVRQSATQQAQDFIGANSAPINTNSPPLAHTWESPSAQIIPNQEPPNAGNPQGTAAQTVPGTSGGIPPIAAGEPGTPGGTGLAGRGSLGGLAADAGGQPATGEAGPGVSGEPRSALAWEQPGFVDRPDASAIVQNRTVPGAPLQQAIDQATGVQRPQGMGLADLRQAGAWERPEFVSQSREQNAKIKEQLPVQPVYQTPTPQDNSTGAQGALASNKENQIPNQGESQSQLVSSTIGNKRRKAQAIVKPNSLTSEGLITPSSKPIEDLRPLAERLLKIEQDAFDHGNRPEDQRGGTELSVAAAYQHFGLTREDGIGALRAKLAEYGLNGKAPLDDLRRAFKSSQATQSPTPAGAKVDLSQSQPETKPKQYRDTRGTGVRFHGTSKPLPEGGPTNNGVFSGNVKNIYGQGFYTTDAVDIASGYTKKGKGGEPTIYEIQERRPVNLYDMESAMDADTKAMAKQVFGNLYATHNAETGDAIRSLAELFDEVRAESRQEGVSADEVQEMFDSVRYVLEKKGYRGFTHVGGKTLGRKAHQVNIYWFPEDDLNVTHGDLEKFIEGATRPTEIANAEKQVSASGTSSAGKGQVSTIPGKQPKSVLEASASTTAKSSPSGQDIRVGEEGKVSVQSASSLTVTDLPKENRFRVEGIDVDQAQAALKAAKLPVGSKAGNGLQFHQKTKGKVLPVLQQVTQGETNVQPAESLPEPAPAQTPAQEPATAPAEGKGREAVERRANLSERKRVGEMTPDEMRRALLTDELTGLGNRRAFEEDMERTRPRVIASVDADSLKFVNDNMSPDSGDEMLRAIGQALGRFSDRAYHISGDEFYLLGDDEAAVQEALAKAENLLSRAVIKYEKQDGDIVTLTGLRITHGTGHDKATADTQLKANKREREAKGLRAARGEPPPGYARRPAAGRADNQHNTAGEVDTAQIFRRARESRSFDEFTRWLNGRYGTEKRKAWQASGQADKWWDEARQPEKDGAEAPKEQDNGNEASAEHIESGQTEPVTQAVVNESVQKSADKTPLNLKEAKAYLLGEIDKAIVDANDLTDLYPSAQIVKGRVMRPQLKGKPGQWRKVDKNDLERIGYVTFDVPGDGKFRVLNVKERLEDFRKKVEKSGGFSEPRKVSTMPKPESVGPVSETIREMAESNNPEDVQNAIEMLRLNGKADEASNLEAGLPEIQKAWDERPRNAEGWMRPIEGDRVVSTSAGAQKAGTVVKTRDGLKVRTDDNITHDILAGYGWRVEGDTPQLATESAPQAQQSDIADQSQTEAKPTESSKSEPPTGRFITQVEAIRQAFDTVKTWDQQTALNKELLNLSDLVKDENRTYQGQILARMDDAVSAYAKRNKGGKLNSMNREAIDRLNETLDNIATLDAKFAPPANLSDLPVSPEAGVGEKVEPKSSRLSQQDFAERPQRTPVNTVANGRKALIKNGFGRPVSILEKSGLLKLVQSVSDIPLSAFGIDESDVAPTSDVVLGADNSETLSASSIISKYSVVQGLFDGKTVYLVFDNIRPGTEVGVFLHEFEHSSLEEMLGKDKYKDLSSQFKGLLDSGDPIAKNVEGHIQDLLESKLLQPEWVNSERLAYTIEYAAMADEKEKAKWSDKFKQFVAQLYAALRAAFYRSKFYQELEKHGIRIQLTPRDLAALARQSVLWRAQQAQMEGLSGARASLAETAGATAKEQTEAKKLWQEYGTDSPYFKEWFGDSKIRKGGKPLKVYHGTNTDLAFFDAAKLKSVTNHDTAGLGFFFATDEGTAREYAQKSAERGGRATVGGYYLRIENPYVVTSDLLDSRMGNQTTEQFRRKLEDDGHDGIYVKDAGYLVAFSPEQIKSTENLGTFDRNRKEVRLSVAESFDQALKQASPKAAKAAILTRLEDTKAWETLKRQILGGFTPRMVAEMSHKVLPMLQDRLIPEREAMEETQVDEQKRFVTEIAEPFLNLIRDAEQAAREVSDLLLDSRLTGVDAAQGEYQPLINIKDAQQKIRALNNRMKSAPGDRKDTLMRERQDLTNQIRHEANRKRSAPAMYARYNALKAKNPKAAEVYDQVVKYGNDWIEDYFKALEKKVRDLRITRKVKAEMLARLQRERENRRVQGPYVPLSRFGRFWISYALKDGERTVERFETETQWKQAQRSIEAEGGEILGAGKQILEDLRKGEVGLDFVSQVDEMLASLPATPELDDVRNELYQLYLENLPDVSSRKHFIQAKKTPGYSRDVLRALSDKAHHDANLLSRIQHAHKLRAALDDAREAVDAAASKAKRDALSQRIAELEMLNEHQLLHKDEATTVDVLRNLGVDEEDERSRLNKAFKEMRRQFGDLDEVQSEIDRLNAVYQVAEGIRKQDAKVFASDVVGEMNLAFQSWLSPNVSPATVFLNQFGFFMHLAMSPAQFIANALQAPIMSAPMAAAKFGFAKANRAFAQAYREFIGASVKVKGLGSLEDVLKGEELRAFKDSSAMIDRTQTFDTAELGESSAASAPVRRKIMNALTYFMHNSERMNREVTFIAAFRLARQNGMVYREAMNYAHKLIADTHYDYSSMNRARFMRGNFARVVTQFKSYSLHTTYLLGKLIHDSVRGGTPAENAEARKALAGILGMQFMFAGTLGLPIGGMALAAQMLSDLFGDDDEPWDWEADWREFLAEHLGQELGRAVATGVIPEALNQAGLGGDFHAKLSMADLWWREPDREMEGKQSALYWLTQLLGPSAGSFVNLFDAQKLLAEGHSERALERVLPKFARDFAQSARFLMEGEVKSLRGDPIVEDVNVMEDVIKALGFNPTRITEAYALNRANSNLDQFMSARRTWYLDRYAEAMREKDTDWMQEIRQDIQAWNLKHPAYRITGKDIAQSLKQRQRISRRNIQQGAYRSSRFLRSGEEVSF